MLKVRRLRGRIRVGEGNFASKRLVWSGVQGWLGWDDGGYFGEFVWIICRVVSFLLSF